MREYRLKSLRQQIAMVLQPPLVFPISVRDNIAYGRPEASDAEIERAAHLARIHDLIASLPEGYATMLGDAATLSEGEKQRLTIARAILREAPILVLDEPTSALDVETEALVMEGIDRLTREPHHLHHRPPPGDGARGRSHRRAARTAGSPSREASPR